MLKIKKFLIFYQNKNHKFTNKNHKFNNKNLIFFQTTINNKLKNKTYKKNKKNKENKKNNFIVIIYKIYQ